MTRERSRQKTRGSLLLGLSVGMFLASGGLVAAYFALDSSAEPGLAVAEAAETHEKLEVTATATIDAEAFLATTVTLKAGEKSVTIGWAGLGFAADDSLAAAGVVPVTATPDKLKRALLALKEELDSSPRNARLDMDARKVWPAQDGQSVDLFGAMGAVEVAARTGTSEVVLPTAAIPAEVTVEDLGISDISHVLATFTTKFSIREKSRNYNLKHSASKLHGYVFKPGELFSFNDVVGARTEREGYKIAHVIQGGEMVDGQGGGTCQISTTLHGSSFFAGIEIVTSIPHSRPSTYVTLGLDATVVYPNTNLELRNTYDFPVVINYIVARGEATVEILGKKSPYDQNEFERTVVSRIRFDTVTREDFKMPIGYLVVDQLGFPGYKVRRYRRYYKNGEVVKEDKWMLRYKPVTEYVRTGANPDPNLPPPKKRKLHGPRPSSGTHRVVQ